MPPPSTAPIRSRRWLAAGGIAVAAIILGALVAFATDPAAEPPPTATPTPAASRTESPSPSPSPTASPSPKPSPSPTPAGRCPLDGEPLARGTAPTEPALAVQIENHPDARPARNLTNADMVIEATVEGDTTRFTAIYLCNDTEGMTGPVRSARYYNVDLWQDLRVLTIGFGRSDGAHERFVRAGMPYPDGMDGPWPWYQRFGSRPAPHNLYVDLQALRDDLDKHERLMALANRVDELRPPFRFSQEAALPVDGRNVRAAEMWTNGYWRFAFTWDADLEAWRRSDAGVPIEDEATGDPVAPTSLVVQRVTQETVLGDPDPGGSPRRLQHLVGRGDGVLYTGGRAFDLRWERPTATDATIWTFAATGEPVELPPGQVWLEILPVEARLIER